jgi:ABC-type nickel/cobalt efflux system permease component RcnA
LQKENKNVNIVFKGELVMEGSIMTSWLALSIGFLHALEPGHGKTALFTYLASGRKTWRDGLVISLSSALTHSLAVFLIAFISHYILHHNVTEEGMHELSGFLGIISGGIIFALGIWVILKTRRGEDLHKNCCGHSQDHNHQHISHNDGHNQKRKNNQFSKTSLLTSGFIGVATGMIPCPTVIVAYLSGVSTGNTYLGLQSVTYFALGMFLALMLVVAVFNFGGEKIIDRFKGGKLSVINWGYIQGCLFMSIGVFTALLH